MSAEEKVDETDGKEKSWISLPSDLRQFTKKKDTFAEFVKEKWGRAEQANWPHSYRSNTQQEETTLEHVENFRRQFIQLFPHRPALLLTPKNECNVEKFVCTSIRPTELPFVSAYNLEETAEFVADFLDFIPHTNPDLFPDMLLSPSTLVQMRAGDCLDMSNFLVSLLRGNGYNAYCVSGFATRWTSFCDQSHAECPERYLQPAFPPEEVVENPETEAAAALANDSELVYGAAPKGPAFESKHVSKFAAWKEAREAERQRRAEADAKEKAKAEMSAERKRSHVWVLVKAGRRDVPHDVFVEASSGAIFPVTKSPYLGIEAVWNEHNYWVNVQDTDVANTSFDLSDTAGWEYVLLDGDTPQASYSAQQQGEEEKEEAAAVDIQTAARDILDAPISWCAPVKIERDVFRGRYPDGFTNAKYHKCIVEKFSEFDLSNDLLTMRVMLFEDEACSKQIEVRESFKHRADKMFQRNMLFGLKREERFMFLPGHEFKIKDQTETRKSGLKEFMLVQGQERRFKFYPGSRVDGLVQRVETAVTITETFKGREDFLEQRTITLQDDADEDTHEDAPKGFELDHWVPVLSDDEEEDEMVGSGQMVHMRICKMEEQYARDDSKDAEQDLRTLTHFVTESKTRIDYHYGANRITASRVEFYHGTGNNMVVLPPGRTMTDNEKAVEKHRLQQRQKQLMSEVKDREQEIEALVKTLQAQAQETNPDKLMQKNIYDIAQDQSGQTQHRSADEEKKAEVVGVDYLTPFLESYDKDLTLDNALAVREACLKALKERLLERANIVTKHLEDEYVKMKEIQAKKDRSGAGADSNQYYKAVEDVWFRILILKGRLKRDTRNAIQKHAELLTKLDNDPRLRKLQQFRNH